MGELSPVHWLIILLLFALLFGAKRLPDAARGLGRSLRIFKAEMRAANDENQAPVAPVTPVADAVPARPAEPVTDQVRPPQSSQES